MLSKGSVAILPLVLLIIVWWQRRRLTRWDLLRSAPYFAVAAALTLVNIACQHRGLSESIRSVSFAQRLAGAGAVVWFYLSKAMAPIDLVFVYPQWRIQTARLIWWLPLAAAAILTALLWRHRHSAWSRAILFGWAFFCAALMPVLGFADVGFMQYSLVADHYPYIALIGLVALVAAGFSYWHRANGRSASMGGRRNSSRRGLSLPGSQLESKSTLRRSVHAVSSHVGQKSRLLGGSQ